MHELRDHLELTGGHEFGDLLVVREAPEAEDELIEELHRARRQGLRHGRRGAREHAHDHVEAVHLHDRRAACVGCEESHHGGQGVVELGAILNLEAVRRGELVDDPLGEGEEVALGHLVGLADLLHLYARRVGLEGENAPEHERRLLEDEAIGAAEQAHDGSEGIHLRARVAQQLMPVESEVGLGDEDIIKKCEDVLHCLLLVDVLQDHDEELHISLPALHEKRHLGGDGLLVIAVEHLQLLAADDARGLVGLPADLRLRERRHSLCSGLLGSRPSRSATSHLSFFIGSLNLYY
mmetsp:Transcript_14162/g.38147  ORF Transcript_14162/g.38147 Transcript_14162/m.38147 type:complete len:294 (-) Transcript_14162:49-930(-)